MSNIQPTFEELQQQLKQLTDEEEQLTEQSDFLEEILDNSVDVYWQYDLEGNPLYLSDAHKQYGYSKERDILLIWSNFLKGRIVIRLLRHGRTFYSIGQQKHLKLLL